MAGSALTAQTTARSSVLATFGSGGSAVQELVVTNQGSDTVSVFKSNGDGTFGAPTNYSTNTITFTDSQPYSITTADVNKDGNLDLLVADFNGGVSVLLGNANGTFQTASGVGVGTAPQDVTTGDFNNDGNLDLAVATNAGASVLLGNGNGTFQSARFLTAGSPAGHLGVAIGEFSGDTNPDLLVSSPTDNGVFFFQGNGNGTFKSGVKITTDSSPQAIALGDFNKDSQTDFAVACSGSNVVDVFLGNGNGTFKKEPTLATGTGPTAVSAADFDQDGNLDLVSSDSGSSQVSIFVGNGDGTFATGVTQATGTGGAHLMAIGDINKDSQLDIIVPNSTAASNNVSVLLNGTNLTEFVFSGAPSGSVAAGTPFTMTVTAESGCGTTITGYTGTIHFTSNDTRAVLPGDYTFTGADAGVHTFTFTLKTSGSDSITATDTVLTGVKGSQTGIAITPLPATHFFVSQFPNPNQAGVTGSFVVLARDQFNNLDTNYRGTVHFTTSDPSSAVRLPANYTFTAVDGGMHRFNATLFTAGTQSITATDTVTSSITGSQTGIVITPAAVSRFAVAGYPTPVQAGTTGNFTVTALDIYNNKVTSYTGTVHFTSSDKNAATVLPANYTFTAGDAGVHTFSATLVTAGTQSITATDTVTSTVNGSQKGITITPLAATHFSVTGFPSPVVAGTAGNFVVKALDQYGNVDTTYRGTVHFTSTDPNPAAVLPGNYTFSSSGDKGVHTFSATLVTAGTQSITATDTVTSSITGSQTVTVNPAAATHLSVGGFPSPVVAGTASNFTVAALDTYGNTATGYRGTVTFTSADPRKSLPANYKFTAGDNGVHTFSATLRTAGTQTIGAADTVTSSIKGAQTGIAVTPAAADHFNVALFPSPSVAGTTASFRVIARDPFNNTDTNYRGTVHFTSSDSNGAVILPSDYTFTAGDAGVHSFSAKLVTAGAQSITATDTVTSSITGSQTGIVINPAAAVHFAVFGFPSPTAAGSAKSFTVTALDPYGNTATGYTGTVQFSSSDTNPSVVLPAPFTFTSADLGVHSFSAILVTAGTQSITAIDTVTSSITGSQTGIVITPLAATQLSVAGFPSPIQAGTSANFVVTALDQFGNTATSYAGTVHFTSSDSNASVVLPGDYTFVSGDAGVHTFSATLVTAGTQSITATDTVTSSIKGSQTAISVTPSAATSFTVSGFPSPQQAGTSAPFVVTAFDIFRNVATNYLGTVHFTTSDTNSAARLPTNYTFTAADAGVHTFNATLVTAGTQSITATDTVTSSITGSQTGITITPAALHHFRVFGFANPTVAGVAHSVSVQAKDIYGNTVTGYTGTVHFTSSDGQAVLPADYTFTGSDAGTHAFSGVTLKTAGTQSITATDTVSSSVTGQQVVTVQAAAAASFTISGPTSTSTGTANTYTVTAFDAFGNIATGYTGTIHFSSSDSAASLPADYKFTSGDAGSHTFTNGVTFNTVSNNTTLAAVDTVFSSIKGSLTGITVV
jgi:hypothetical protein